jgi:L-threonylcarbamoyladenylate synthase
VQRIIVDAHDPEPRAIHEAALVVRKGGIVAIPTDTLYGLAVDPFRPDAVANVFAAKGRLTDRALPLVAADVVQVEDRIGPLPLQGRRLASRFWPGPLTLLVAAPSTLAAGIAGSDGTVGVRVPRHQVTRELCRACGVPVTATSANISGTPAPGDPDEVERMLGHRIDMLIDAGPTAGGAPSTIVDVSGPLIRLVRAGPIAWAEVEACVLDA